MRICMLTYYYWPVPAGGTENQCRRLSAALVARGHTCMVLTCRHKITDAPKQTEESGALIIRKPILETLLQISGCFQTPADVRKIGKQATSIQKTNKYNIAVKLRKFLAAVELGTNQST